MNDFTDSKDACSRARKRVPHQWHNLTSIICLAMGGGPDTRTHQALHHVPVAGLEEGGDEAVGGVGLGPHVRGEEEGDGVAEGEGGDLGLLELLPAGEQLAGADGGLVPHHQGGHDGGPAGHRAVGGQQLVPELADGGGGVLAPDHHVPLVCTGGTEGGGRRTEN